MLERALCPTLVGRDEQLFALEDALLAAHRGESRFVVLGGEAGMGKTRLARELATRARRLDWQVLWGACSEAELPLPYLPLVEALGNYLSGEDVERLAGLLGAARLELAQLFPQLGGDEPPASLGDPAQAKLRLFEAVVALLAIAARARPAPRRRGRPLGGLGDARAPRPPGPPPDRHAGARPRHVPKRRARPAA